MELKPRNTQTQVKHLILKKYLAAWGGIILHGLRNKIARTRSNAFKIHFVYVDGFAFCGRYKGDTSVFLEKPSSVIVFGSPIIGVRALDDLQSFAQEKYAIDIQVNAILVEKEREVFDELKQSLQMAGMGKRVKETDDFDSLSNGQIALLHEDFCKIAQRICTYTRQDYKFSFYFLDPYGPSGIPFSIVGEIIRQQRTDVMINFPYQDLHRKAGLLEKPDISLKTFKHIQHYDAMYGDEQWQEVYREAVSRGYNSREIEMTLVDLYYKALQRADPTLAIKYVRLQFPDRNRTMFYLFLTTHDPTGALKINEILDEAKLREFELRQHYQSLKEIRKAREKGQLVLEGVLESAFSQRIAQTPSSRCNAKVIADEIYDNFRGRNVPFREVLRTLANSPYYYNDIKKAMKILKDRGLVKYKHLRNDAEIEFKG